MDQITPEHGEIEEVLNDAARITGWNRESLLRVLVEYVRAKTVDTRDFRDFVEVKAQEKVNESISI
jgi:hypothetical protein